MGSSSPSEQLQELPELPELRREFPVLEECVYLNTGTCGPLPRGALDASRAELEREARAGRTQAHHEQRRLLEEALRAEYATLLGCASEELALTTCTSEGVSLVVSGLALRPGDEILTSDEEHPGLLGALQAARDLRGVSVRTTAFEDIAAQVSKRTRLVACSHVSWVNGATAPAALAAVPDDVPVLLDGAQGVGAVPVDVRALGADAYAGSGQKWLCGPDGLGMLYVSPQLRERLEVGRRGYTNFQEANDGLAARLHPDARRYDCFSLSAEAVAAALASLRVLADSGWAAVHRRSRTLAAQLVERLAACGRTVAARGPSTLVSFSSTDAHAERTRLADRGVVVRDIPKRSLLRASVGAWNDERDLERLVEALAEPA
jgi:L-cysteine/cystine lyase